MGFLRSEPAPVQAQTKEASVGLCNTRGGRRLCSSFCHCSCSFQGLIGPLVCPPPAQFHSYLPSPHPPQLEKPCHYLAEIIINGSSSSTSQCQLMLTFPSVQHLHRVLYRTFCNTQHKHSNAGELRICLSVFLFNNVDTIQFKILSSVCVQC